MSPQNTTEFSCICCFQNYKSERLRDRHFPLCFQKFSNTPHETRIPSDPSMCLYCGAEFRGEYELGQHSILMHHANTDVNSRCFLCGRKGFHSQLDMNRHRELHDNLKHLELTHTITCPTCDQTFGTRSLFQKHMHSAHRLGTAQHPEADRVQNDATTNTSESRV